MSWWPSCTQFINFPHIKILQIVRHSHSNFSLKNRCWSNFLLVKKDIDRTKPLFYINEYHAIFATRLTAIYFWHCGTIILLAKLRKRETATKKLRKKKLRKKKGTAEEGFSKGDPFFRVHLVLLWLWAMSFEEIKQLYEITLKTGSPPVWSNLTT